MRSGLTDVKQYSGACMCAICRDHDYERHTLTMWTLRGQNVRVTLPLQVFTVAHYDTAWQAHSAIMEADVTADMQTMVLVRSSKDGSAIERAHQQGRWNAGAPPKASLWSALIC